MSDTETTERAAAEDGAAPYHGSFIWYELMTSDQDAAIGFYTKVVGWTASDADQPDMRYTILSAGGRGVGGIMQLTDENVRNGRCPARLARLYRRRRYRRQGEGDRSRRRQGS